MASISSYPPKSHRMICLHPNPPPSLDLFSPFLKSPTPTSHSPFFHSPFLFFCSSMACGLLWVVCPRENGSATALLGLINSRSCVKGRSQVFKCSSRLQISTGVSAISSAVTEPARSSEEKVYEVVLKQAALLRKDRALNLKDVEATHDVLGNWNLLNEAYDRCGEVCAEYAKTFYLGSDPIRLYTLFQSFLRGHGSNVRDVANDIRAAQSYLGNLWRTDELVDGPNASHITPKALDRWEKRLDVLFSGHPYDMYDAALSDTVSKYPVDIQPFRDMIEGMRMDLVKSRYKNFDELYLYCYYVAGTVGLMSVPVMGISPESKASTESVYNAALALGIANQLTNILRDVGEDARRGRIYLPQDELAQAGLSDEDIFNGKVTEKWRSFMKDQIKRARMFFDEAEKGVEELNAASRWPVWASLIIYRQILDAIEANDYDNFSKRAYVGKAKKFLSLPVAYGRALIGPSKYVEFA